MCSELCLHLSPRRRGWRWLSVGSVVSGQRALRHSVRGAANGGRHEGAPKHRAAPQVEKQKQQFLSWVSSVSPPQPPHTLSGKTRGVHHCVSWKLSCKVDGAGHRSRQCPCTQTTVFSCSPSAGNKGLSAALSPTYSQIMCTKQVPSWVC